MNKLNINKTVTIDCGNEKEVCLIWNISTVQGNIVECMTPEGISDDYCYHIKLESMFGDDVYILNTTIYGKIKHYDYEDFSEGVYVNARIIAENLVEHIKSVGFVDLSKWHLVDRNKY